VRGSQILSGIIAETTTVGEQQFFRVLKLLSPNSTKKVKIEEEK